MNLLSTVYWYGFEEAVILFFFFLTYLEILFPYLDFGQTPFEQWFADHLHQMLDTENDQNQTVRFTQTEQKDRNFFTLSTMEKRLIT